MRERLLFFAGTLTLLLAGGLLLSACASDANSGTGQGTGVFGASMAHGPTDGIGAIGAALDEEDRQRAYAAQMQALQYGEPGLPVGWRSPDGRHGTVVPGPAYQSSGATCREFTHSIFIDGRPQTTRGTACRNSDGSWSPLG